MISLIRSCREPPPPPPPPVCTRLAAETAAAAGTFVESGQAIYDSKYTAAERMAAISAMREMCASAEEIQLMRFIFAGGGECGDSDEFSIVFFLVFYYHF